MVVQVGVSWRGSVSRFSLSSLVVYQLCFFENEITNINDGDIKSEVCNKRDLYFNGERDT